MRTMTIGVSGYIRFVLKQKIKRAKATVIKRQKDIASWEKELAKLNKKAKK